jgi:Mg-chelatase subunit ChlD
VVVLLDNSYSMGFGDHWQRATAAARDQFAKMSASDRATLVLFSSGADIQMRSTSEKARFNAVLDTVKPGDAATRYSPALKVAGSIVAESTLPRREVVIISDFQRGGWRGEEGARLPQGVTLTPVAIQGAADKANLSVTGLSLARSTFSNQERLTVTCRRHAIAPSGRYRAATLRSRLPACRWRTSRSMWSRAAPHR